MNQGLELGLCTRALIAEKYRCTSLMQLIYVFALSSFKAERINSQLNKRLNIS